MTAEEYIKAYTRGSSNELVGGGYHEWLTPENALAAVELAREEMRAKQVATIKCEKKSPITGGEMRLMQEKSSVKFRGEDVTYIKKYYHCVESGNEFTDTDLDDDNMWAIFRAYWERKGFEHFYDIDGYREEQEPASPCENCEGNGLPGTCASISSLGRCPLEYRKQEPASEDLERCVVEQMEAFKKNVEQLKAQAEKRYDEIGKSDYMQPNLPLAKGTDNIVTVEYANNHNKEHAASLGYYNGVIRTCEKIVGFLKEPTKKSKI